MPKLYHYIKKGNTALTDGILSFAKNPNADLSYYYKRSGAETHQGIVEWMESCFTGRSRSIRVFSEPIQWTEKSIKCLKEFIDNADMFEIDLDSLERDGLIEAVYVSPSVLEDPTLNENTVVDEILHKLNGVQDISYAPIDWSVCDDELRRRFAYVRYYLITLKNGLIPPQYITLGKKDM